MKKITDWVLGEGKVRLLLFSGIIGIGIYALMGGNFNEQQSKYYYILLGLPIFWGVKYFYWNSRRKEIVEMITKKDPKASSAIWDLMGINNNLFSELKSLADQVATSLENIEKNKLLTAKIIFDDNKNEFFVSFDIHQENLKNDEYVRLFLHYYAKTLFNFDPSVAQDYQYALLLKALIETILSEGIKKESNILGMANLDGEISLTSNEPLSPYKFTASLLYVDEQSRTINTDLPKTLYLQHMVGSVIVLLHVLVRNLDEGQIEILYHSLTYMNSAYNSKVSFSDINNLNDVPNLAYITALNDSKK